MKCCVLTLVLICLIMWRMQSYSADALRKSYVKILQTYESVPYVWGGESRAGIDCSGLMRVAFVDALQEMSEMYWRWDLLWQSFHLKIHDFKASSLLSNNEKFVFIERIKNLNQADLSAVQAGDLGVLENGAHVIIYLGNREWIEANGTHKQVVRVRLPSKTIPHYSKPILIYRWRLLL